MLSSAANHFDHVLQIRLECAPIRQERSQLKRASTLHQNMVKLLMHKTVYVIVNKTCTTDRYLEKIREWRRLQSGLLYRCSQQ
jgi:hypothetical protein